MRASLDTEACRQPFTLSANDRLVRLLFGPFTVLNRAKCRRLQWVVVSAPPYTVAFYRG